MGFKDMMSKCFREQLFEAVYTNVRQVWTLLYGVLGGSWAVVA